MKRIPILLAFILLLLANISKAQYVNIPDPVFKSYLLGTVSHPTSSTDITPAEAAAYKGVMVIQYYNYRQIDLTGINAFTGFTALYCDYDSIINFNLSGCTSLNHIECEYCQFNSMNVSGCEALTYLVCQYDDSLISLDLSSDTALQYLLCTYDYSLRYLNIKNGHNDILTSMDALGNYHLKCIQVDNVAKANGYKNWVSIASYTTDSLCGTLPIKFINVTATKTNIGNKISWFVGNDYNVENYTVQQSINGTDFSNIAIVSARNTTTYSYLAQNTNYKLYYRIMATEKDGTVSYSQIMSLDNSRMLLMKIFPNPAIDFITIESNNIQQIKVVDNTGRTILHKRLETVSDITKMNVSSLSKGLYLIQVINTNGETKTEKLIIQ